MIEGCSPFNTKQANEVPKLYATKQRPPFRAPTKFYAHGMKEYIFSCSVKLCNMITSYINHISLFELDGIYSLRFCKTATFHTLNMFWSQELTFLTLVIARDSAFNWLLL